MTLQALSMPALKRAEGKAAESVANHCDGDPYHHCKGCGPHFSRLWAIWDEISKRRSSHDDH